MQGRMVHSAEADWPGLAGDGSCREERKRVSTVSELHGITNNQGWRREKARGPRDPPSRDALVGRAAGRRRSPSSPSPACHLLRRLDVLFPPNLSSFSPSNSLA